jgi:hypothetical protein
MWAVAMTATDPDHDFAAYPHAIRACSDYRNLAVHELAEPPRRQAAG